MAAVDGDDRRHLRRHVGMVAGHVDDIVPARAGAAQDRADLPIGALIGGLERLALALPDARLEWIEDAFSFSPEDRPDRVAELVAEFARA